MFHVAIASFTRPANTTTYTANDGVSNHVDTPTIMTFKDVARYSKRGGFIRSAVLHKSDQDTTNADFSLYLFRTTVAVAGFNDNEEIAITDAEFLTCVGHIAFANGDAKNVVTGNLWTNRGVDLAFRTDDDDNDLYGVCVADGNYTPGSAEVFQFSLGVEL